MRGKRILITGGTGFIGSWLVERWFKNNEVTLFDNGRRNAFRFLPRFIQNKVKVVMGDVQDIKSLSKVIKDKQIIIHLAAIAGASFYEEDPVLTLNVNFFGTANLLKSLLHKDVEQIIIASSSEVYGPQAEDVSEEDLTCLGSVFEGRWSYATSKVAADHLSFAYFKKYGLPINLIRPFNVYGPRQVGEGAISNMLTDGITTGVIKVTGNGAQKRAWCFVEDFVDAMEKIYTKRIVGDCFNIGTPNAYITILELAKMLRKLIGDCKIELIQKKKTEVYNRKPNIRRAQQRLNYEPKVTLDEGLKKTFLWWKENITKF